MQTFMKALILTAFPMLPRIANTITLSTHLAYMLHLAEMVYGPRDRSFTFVGIDFTKTEYPSAFYPLGYDSKDISIHLTYPCLNNRIRGCYQLAHECVHLLSPIPYGTATLLEEGLATYFSQNYLQAVFNKDWSDSGLPSYNHASILVQELLALDPFAIRKLRETQSVISGITANHLLQAHPTLSEQIALELTQLFQRNEVSVSTEPFAPVAEGKTT